MTISVVICTYNRADIIGYCLDSLCQQSVSDSCFEVIVVDNNSSDNTKDVVQEYISANSNIRYVSEKTPGASHARNLGARESITDWVLYLDDDAKVPPDFIMRALELSRDYNFDCFGGSYNAWFLSPPPRWLPTDFGFSNRFSTNVTILNKDYLSAGIFAVKKDLLLKIGGFSRTLGPKGTDFGYGEETELQDRIRQYGYVIGYDPSFYMDHLVGKHKYKFDWHLNNLYIHGRDLPRIWHDTNKYLHITKWTAKTCSALVKNGLVGILKLLYEKDYYWENYLLDTKGKYYFLKGLYSNIRTRS